MEEGWQVDGVEGLERGRVEAHEVSWALRDMQRAALELDQVLAHRLRMRAIEYAAMGHLMDSPGALGPVELSVRLGISTGSGTELVDRLERAGHVQRQRHLADRRRLTLHATDSGVGQILGELAPLFTALDTLADDLSPAEQDAVTRYLRAATQRMRDFAHQPARGTQHR